MKQKQSTFNENWEIIESLKLPYTCFGRYHIRIDQRVDFWPSTSKWMVTNEFTRRRGGIKAMIKYLDTQSKEGRG